MEEDFDFNLDDPMVQLLFQVSQQTLRQMTADLVQRARNYQGGHPTALEDAIRLTMAVEEFRR